MSETNIESVPLTPANINAMDPETWGRTFMPSLMQPDTAPDEEVVDDAPVDDAADTPTRGPDGKFVAAPVTDDTPATDTPAEPAADTPPIVTTLPFAVVGADGAAVDPATLSTYQVTMKAGGQDVTKPLADVVRLAQSAEGQTRALNVKQGELTTLQAQLTEAANATALLESALEQVLTSDDARAALVAQYRAYTAPEAELARLKQQQADDAARASRSAAETQQQSQALDLVQSVTSALEGLLSTYPEVTPEELLGRFHTGTAHWAVNGVIPPEHYEKVSAFVAQSLTPYAAQRHGRIAELQAKAEAADAKAQAAAQAAAQATKNAQAAAVRPSGTPATAGAAAKPPIRTLKEATSYALGAFGTP